MTQYLHCIIFLGLATFMQGYSQLDIVQTDDSSSSLQELFDQDDYLELKIIADIDSILRDTDEDPSYQDAQICYKNEEGSWISLNAQIRVRGHYRKSTENCNFPPLKIRIDKDERSNTIFENARELKMVTHCQSELPEYDQYVVQEFLIYRLYAVLSDVSYKTRLLRVTYLDKDDPGLTYQKYAFFVEDQDMLEERLHGHIVSVPTVLPENIDWNHYMIISFFQYLIINTDWSLPIMHNIDLISLDYFKPPVPIPFDFDWSGLINIPYKVPTAGGMQTRIAERVYKGPCLNRKDAKKIKRFFMEKREALFNIYIDCPYLDYDTKIETLNNLQLFYQILEDKYIFDEIFLDQCRNE